MKNTNTAMKEAMKIAKYRLGANFLDVSLTERTEQCLRANVKARDGTEYDLTIQYNGEMACVFFEEVRKE